MATTQIADLWEPVTWIKGTQEAMNSFPNLFNSPAVAQSPRLNALCNGPGNGVTMPFLHDITDQSNAIQVESTAIAKQKITGKEPTAVALNRETGNSVSALSEQISGTDPLKAILMQIAQRRLKQKQKTTVAMVRGQMASALSGNSNDNFVEVEANQTSAHFISGNMVIDTATLFGEMIGYFMNASIWMHPIIHGALVKQDATDFTIESLGSLKIPTYKKMPLYLSNSLVRAGTTDGYVYDTYLIGNGTLLTGAKPQAGDVRDVASMQMDFDKEINDESVYDRTREAYHIDGLDWTGTPAGQSPTDAELATSGNWALRYASADRVKCARIQTNG